MSLNILYLGQIPHSLDKTLKHRFGSLLIDRSAQKMPLAEILRKRALVQNLQEYLDTLVFLDILEYLQSVDLFVLVALEEFHLFLEIVEEFLLVAVF